MKGASALLHARERRIGGEVVKNMAVHVEQYHAVGPFEDDVRIPDLVEEPASRLPGCSFGRCRWHSYLQGLPAPVNGPIFTQMKSSDDYILSNGMGPVKHVHTPSRLGTAPIHRPDFAGAGSGS